MKNVLFAIIWTIMMTIGVLVRLSLAENEPSVKPRLRSLTHHPCSSCHDENMKPIESWEEKPRKAHWDVVLSHAKGVFKMECSTCHIYGDMNQLHLLDGKKISFDESHRLCAQCHFDVAQDWKGGAHGKREGGWEGEQVIKSCAECHNPHSPALKKRWPVEHVKKLRIEK